MNACNGWAKHVDDRGIFSGHIHNPSAPVIYILPKKSPYFQSMGFSFACLSAKAR